MRHYTRGRAGREGRSRTPASRKSSSRRDQTSPAEAIFANNKAADLFAIAEDMLEGEILFREEGQEAIESLRAACAEDKLRYSSRRTGSCRAATPWGDPVHDEQPIGGGRVPRDLRRWPNNGWSLHGLAACLDAQGRKDEAAVVKKQFADVWKRADVKIPSSCFCVEK